MTQHITIPNPDDTNDSMPIYDGPADQIADHLTPGIYTDLDGNQHWVAVPITDKAHDVFVTQITYGTEAALEASGDLKVKIGLDADLYHVLEWHAGPAAKAAAQARLWADVKHDYENPPHDGVGPVEILRHHIDKVATQLLNNYVIEKSSDPMTNALSHFKAEAYARFHEQATALLTYITKE